MYEVRITLNFGARSAYLKSCMQFFKRNNIYLLRGTFLLQDNFILRIIYFFKFTQMIIPTDSSKILRRIFVWPTYIWRSVKLLWYNLDFNHHHYYSYFFTFYVRTVRIYMFIFSWFLVFEKFFAWLFYRRIPMLWTNVHKSVECKNETADLKLWHGWYVLLKMCRVLEFK